MKVPVYTLVLGLVLICLPVPMVECQSTSPMTQPGQAQASVATLIEIIRTVMTLNPTVFKEIEQIIDIGLAPSDVNAATLPPQVLQQFAALLQNPAVARIMSYLQRPEVKKLIGVLENKLMNNTLTSGDNETSTASLLDQLRNVDIMATLRVMEALGVSSRMFLPNSPGGLVSDRCYKDSALFVDSLVLGEKWALDMVDATGKIPSGLQKGHLYFTGSFDQCRRIKADVKTLLQRRRQFSTHFCKVQFTIPDSLVNSLNVDTRGVKLNLDWGLCVSEACSEHDVNGLLHIGPLANLSLPVASVHCHDNNDLSQDTSAIAAICVLSIFAALVVFGTLYDITTTSSGKESAKKTFHEQNVDAVLTTNDHNTSNDKTNGLHDGTNGDVTVPMEGAAEMSKTNMDILKGYVAHRESVDDDYETKVKATKATINGGIHKQEDRQKINHNRAPIWGRILVCFSIYTNLPKILHAKSSGGSISCIHGIRFLSLTWIVLGHTYNYGIISSDESLNAENILDFSSILQRFTFQGVIAAGFAVDTFFVLSAFLLTWLKLKDTDKKTRKLTLGDSFMYYFHRIWRLTPPYMLVLMMYVCLSPYFGEGPLWPKFNSNAENCQTSWWTNLLYVNNLVKVDSQCMGWTWYLADDMQFYVISPIFLITMYIMAPLGISLAILMMSIGAAICFWQEYTYNGNFFTMKSDGGDYWQKVYIPPWSRVPSWMVGMLLGYIVYHRKRAPIRNKSTVFLCWIFATGAALFLVYIPYTENKEGGTSWTRVERALYEAFGRPLWSVCVAWLIFACYNNMGGLVNRILSWNGFIPLSRLTYAVYLVHPICMMTYVYSRKTLLYINDYNIIYLYLGHLTIAYMVALIVSLTFEAPFMGLEKVLFGRQRRS